MPDTVRHLVIAGTTKAATTSLFSYLAAHPDVCASRHKESRFFLDPDYPVRVRDLHIERGAADYERLFDACPERPFRLEATPDYLYSPASAELLHKHLDDVRIVLVLRDPIERLASWYRFARQNDDLAADLSFETYVAQQLQGRNLPDTQPWRALEQGRYLAYLEPFLDLYGPDRLFLIDYGAFIADVRDTVEALCRWSGLAEDFYHDFDFGIHNRSQVMRSPGAHSRYRSARRVLRRALGQVPVVGRALRALGRSAEPVYLALNRGGNAPPTSLSDSLQRRLEAYFQRERSWITGASLRLEPPHDTHKAARGDFE